MKRSHTPDNELQNSKNRLKHNTSMDKSGSIQCGVSSTAAQCPPSQHSSQQRCSVGCRMQVPGRLRDKKLAAISEQIMSAPDCLKHSPPLTIRMRKVMIVNICDAEKTKMMAMRLYLTVKLCQNAQYFLLPKIRLVKGVKSRLEIFQKFICFGSQSRKKLVRFPNPLPKVRRGICRE